MPAPDRFARFERLLSLLVGAAALVGALVALYQASLARRQARAAAWPYLGQGNSLSGRRAYVRTVANQGVGPARVRHVRVEVDGRPVPTWEAAVLALTGTPTTGYDYSWLGTGKVLSPNEVDTLLALPSGDQAVAFWRAAQRRLNVVICYCSVYDECWLADDRHPDPASTASCPAPDDPRAFRQ